MRSVVLTTLLAAALPVSAQFESARLHPDNVMPAYPPSLQTAGITRGYAIAAVSIATTV